MNDPNAFRILIPTSDLAALAPEIWLAAAGTLLLLFEAFLPRLRRAVPFLALGAVGVAAWLVAQPAAAHGAFGGLVRGDLLTVGWSQLLLLATALALLASRDFLRRERLASGEYEALFLWCAAGLLLLVRSAELLTLFLALELLSLCLYALAAFNRGSAWSTEAAIKYFLMGAFVSAFVLYGIALVYGQTAATSFAGIAERIASGVDSPALLILGFLLLVAGFGFKMSMVPFHAWAPDVYQGAPSPFVAFLSVAPKAASAFVLATLLVLLDGSVISDRWPSLVALLAVASMAVGNLFALVQRDIKRMLAYSGIAHMGYAVIPLAAIGGTTEFWRPLFVYLVAYVLMNAGAFAIVSVLYRRVGEQHSIADLGGWGYRFPLLGICLTICLLSLAGIPPTAGFLGKYLVFLHAIGHGQLWLALVGIAAALVGVVYYLRVVYVLYMKPEQAEPEVTPRWTGNLAAIAAAAGSLAVGIWPERLLGWIETAVASLAR
ncbi:MAG: NADH-quinone oxidoreductase subunit N [Thermoanaerobaculia bacterium]|nr:NADH-quinone oxidoreductase subunit N [Thermoanaerobaculia bacterium]MCZ7650870.1 NADH-quinone oxidoreductase subunit N [Thermoanaerobaculia bacterium]